MQWPRKSFVILLTALAALLQPPCVMATEPAPAAPPRAYRLETLELRVQRQPGAGQPGQALVVAGTGSASLESGRPALLQPFTLSAAEVVGLVNGLYRLRFFDLPAVLGARPSVFLMPDGMLGTQVARLSDSTSTNVCISLPGYDKCVRYADGDGPQELETWVRAALADARRRAQPTTPGNR